MTEAGPALKLAAAGHDLIRDGRFDLAWQAVELALAVDPLVANAHTLRAHLLELRGAFDPALSHWREAVRLLPDSAGHRFNLALSLLRQGSLDAGFALAEARIEKPEWSNLGARGSFAGLQHRVPAPGADLSTKRVLAFTEQGLGDNLWAARWLPALAARSGSLDLACRPALRPLLEGLVPGDVLGPPDGDEAAKLNLAALAGKYDAFVPLMSLPRVLGASEAPANWWAPDADRVAFWRARFVAACGGRSPIIGVVWRANPESESATARLVPPALFAPLASVGLVNLQGGAAEGRDGLAQAFDPLAGGMPDLPEYAAMIAATDRLLTTDTMAAHLAGVIGHPAIVAVPAVPNFYWGLAAPTSRWYPSLQLVRQAPGADWTAVVAAMVGACGV